MFWIRRTVVTINFYSPKKKTSLFIFIDVLRCGKYQRSVFYNNSRPAPTLAERNVLTVLSGRGRKVKRVGVRNVVVVVSRFCTSRTRWGGQHRVYFCACRRGASDQWRGRGGGGNSLVYVLSRTPFGFARGQLTRHVISKTRRKTTNRPPHWLESVSLSRVTRGRVPYISTERVFRS